MWVENFDEIALFGMVKEIEANLCFCIFRNKKFKMAAIFGERKIFLKIGKSIFFGYPVENFHEIALSRLVKEIEAN